MMKSSSPNAPSTWWFIFLRPRNHAKMSEFLPRERKITWILTSVNQTLVTCSYESVTISAGHSVYMKYQVYCRSRYFECHRWLQHFI
jgi:hypothetical protein